MIKKKEKKRNQHLNKVKRHKEFATFQPQRPQEIRIPSVVFVMPTWRCNENIFVKDIKPAQHVSVGPETIRALEHIICTPRT